MTHKTEGITAPAHTCKHQSQTQQDLIQRLDHDTNAQPHPAHHGTNRFSGNGKKGPP